MHRAPWRLIYLTVLICTCSQCTRHASRPKDAGCTQLPLSQVTLCRPLG